MKPLILIDRHEGIHEFLQLQHAVTATHAAYLIILLYAIRLNSRVIDDERHRLLYVGTNLYRSRMVGENCDAYRLVPGAYLIEDRLDESLVEVLDSLQLQFQIAIMTCLVARLYVNINEVVAVLQCLDSCSCLALVVGIGKTGSALNDDVAQTGVMADASNQVYGRNMIVFSDLLLIVFSPFHL